MEGDPLGNLNITHHGIILRDEFVVGEAKRRGIPLLMVFSGGYQTTNAPCIADSIQNLVTNVIVK